jgi:hypothetical protein
MAYLRTRTIASFGTLFAGALVLVACGGKNLDLGTNTTQSQQVAPSEVSGTVPPCAAGAAHPNVCCTAGPNQASSCVTYPGAPFTQCDSSTTTYPDPRSCCPLDGSGGCAAPPPSGGSSGSGSSSGGSTCSYACPPGMYSPAGSSGDTCCVTDPSGATACSGSGVANGSGPNCSGTCSCPACEPDSGACPPCDCPPTPCPTPTPTCGVCPPGWQTPQGQPDLCCAADPSGAIECFSQALPPGQGPGETDGGSSTGPSSGGCSASASTDGAIGPCGCQEQTNGHTYAVNCDPSTNLCTCTLDNGGPSASFPDDGNTCGDITALLTSCGFPVN